MHIHILGICGTFMGGIAAIARESGHKVTGCDQDVYPPMSTQLESQGIELIAGYSPDQIELRPDIFVIGNVVTRGNPLMEAILNQNLPYISGPQWLSENILRNRWVLAVAGTHGKTTTSTMVAHILRHSGYGCNAFLGGIAVNYNSNFWASKKNVSVVEADEYDRSFLKLSPDVAIISSMDPDHLDIYGTAENMEQAFIDFSARIKAGGLLLSKYGLKRTDDLKATEHLTFHLHNENASVYAANIKMTRGSYQFDVLMQYWELKDVVLNMGGLHNIENMIAAISVAHYLEIENDKIREAVAAFKGVKRRFEYIIKNDEQVMVDDYAHHPEELRALLSGAKDLFPEVKCTVIFQPHLYSRTNDFADGFAETLDLADEVILLPIYPARELPMEGVNSEMVLNKMKINNKQVLSKEAVLEWVKDNKIELLITAGAGDIDTLVEPIKKILNNKFGN